MFLDRRENFKSHKITYAGRRGPEEQDRQTKKS
jgi:hypothetical protein